ncbi:hypothetical protein ACSVDE_16725 [Pseudalkalibacillus sp. Hm43]|uniref:hypothetical protein n=1 Tax=Pseudalkalibacillus sp. Hm43 TaxID=3450742 RepID=UPI003F4319AA
MFDENEYRKSYKNISLLFFISMCLLLIIAIFLNIFMKTFTWDSLYISVINSLIGVMIPLVLFNILYDHFTKTYHNREVSDRITEALVFKQELIGRFSDDTKKQFIKNTTESLLGKTEGDMLYSTMIEPYLNNQYSFRRNFKYYISYTNHVPLRSEWFVIDDAAYDWVKQELSFFKNVSQDHLEDNGISVGFSYKERTLDGLYDRKNFFFRENLWVNDNHIDLLQGFSNEEMHMFVKDVLNFRFELDDEEIAYTVRNDKEIEGFYLHFHLPKAPHKDQRSEHKFKIKFQMPQLKSQKKFIAVISEPTYSVDILFSHLQDQVDVIAIPFFDDAEAISTLPNDTVKVELDKWVLPRAGVVFVWDDVKKGAPIKPVEAILKN